MRERRKCATGKEANRRSKRGVVLAVLSRVQSPDIFEPGYSLKEE